MKASFTCLVSALSHSSALSNCCFGLRNIHYRRLRIRGGSLFCSLAEGEGYHCFAHSYPWKNTPHCTDLAELVACEDRKEAGPPAAISASVPDQSAPSALAPISQRGGLTLIRCFRILGPLRNTCSGVNDLRRPPMSSRQKSPRREQGAEVPCQRHARMGVCAASSGAYRIQNGNRSRARAGG